MHFLLNATCSCISHAYVLLFNILDIFETAWDFSDCHSVSLRQLCLWHLSINPLQLGTLFVPVLLHLLILLLLLSSFVMIMHLRHFQRTSPDEAFIRNAKSFCRTLPTLTFPLSLTVGDGSHYVMSWSHVLSCLSRSFTPTCTGQIVQYLSFSLAFEVRASLSHRSWLWMCFVSLGQSFLTILAMSV